MTWAAYAFLDADGKTVEQNPNPEAEGWWELIERALPLVAQEDSPAYAIVASVTDTEFDEAKKITDIQSYPEGRIFGARGEIRWRTWCNGRHLVLLTDAHASVESLRAMGFDGAMPVNADGGGPVPHLLWGKLESDNKWRDGRIPKDLEYPVQTLREGQLTWLRVKSYIDEGGVVQFARYVDVT